MDCTDKTGGEQPGREAFLRSGGPSPASGGGALRPAHLQETYQWLAQKNLVAIASLYSAKVLHHIALSCLSLTHPDHIRAFNDPQEAIAWLDAQYQAQ